MKTVKFEHELADLIRAGKKTATWRIYDDKNLGVNDKIELIDKVDPQDPSTWTTIAFAVIDTMIEKRLGDITAEDMVGHEQFDSRDQMLATYQKYYGPEVMFNTPVRMIHFSLLSKSNSKTTTDTKTASSLVEAKLYADGGSRGNPGPSASGYVIFDMQDDTVVKNGVYLGITTNNQAEYQALKLGLEDALSRGVRIVHVHMDSLLVVNQMLGIFKVKNRDLWPIHDSIRSLLQQFKHVSFNHVPRSLNKQADAEVNKVLDEHAHDSKSA